MTHVIIFLILVFVVSLLAKRLEGTIITGPMVFTFAGVSAYFLAPPLVGRFSETTGAEAAGATILTVAEVALAIVLFGDATRIRLRRVLDRSELATRLLLIGMPLTIVLGSLVGYWLFAGRIPFWEAAILATILAPTDASLGAVVVNSKLVPESIRQALSVESGLNDGLSMPFFVLFLALAGIELHGFSRTWLQFTVMQMGLGVLLGLAIGWLGGKLLEWSEQKGWMHSGSHLIALLSLAILAWGVANSVGGNGFIAAFVAGIALRWAYNNAVDHAEEFEESWAHLLVYFIFYFFGLLAAPWLSHITATIWLYAVFSLTLVRMAPVAVALMGARLKPGTTLFMGWFGPRGLASVVLGLIYLEELSLIEVNENIILAVIATVLLSVLAHGVSAAPLSKLYARYLAGHDANAPEFA
ncbi:MAG: sodium:proton exchanger [Chloroflexi bacterium]|nr:sodium:proton exchanger [Chloroflexota bacterium]